MKYYDRILPCLGMMLLFIASARAQNMADYSGHWMAGITNSRFFTVDIRIDKLNDGRGRLNLSGACAPAVVRMFSIDDDGSFSVHLDSSMAFKGLFCKAGAQLSCFISSGQWQYHAALIRQEGNSYKGEWKILLSERTVLPLFLSIEEAAGEKFAAYAFLADRRFPGFACYDFIKRGKQIAFKDFRTGLSFRGVLKIREILVDISAGPVKLGKVSFVRVPEQDSFGAKIEATAFSSKHPVKMDDDIETSTLEEGGFGARLLSDLVDSINRGSITNTHSVLIARRGKLLWEQYFAGYDLNTPHDLRSASKSISSALVGIAIREGVLEDTAQHIADLLPAYAEIFKTDSLKQQISVGSLLTMSSGLDAIDFGIEGKSAGAEDVYQTTSNWLLTVLKAPMINEPGTHAYYGSANPFLLGAAVKAKLKGSVAWFIDQKLFSPLGIKNYLLQNDCFRNPYFGGGWFLTSRDFLKFGMMYQNGGKWKGKQIVGKEWIESSWKSYLPLENHPQKNPYGFLWWHHRYKVGGQMINSIEARGAGGQYLFVIPQFDLVIVITSGNFRNGRVWQPEKIVEQYILPAIAG